MIDDVALDTRRAFCGLLRRDANLTPVARLVGLEIADNYDRAEVMSAAPTNRYLADRLWVGEATVKRAMSQLRKAGYVRTEMRGHVRVCEPNWERRPS